MSCKELQDLRARVADLRRDLEQHRHTKRSKAHIVRAGRSTSDFDVYLERKLQKAVAAIQEHIVHHGCQD